MKNEIECGSGYVQISDGVTELYLALDTFKKGQPKLWIEIKHVFKYGKQKHNIVIQKPSVQFEYLLEHHNKPLNSVDNESGLSNKAHCAARALLLFYSLIADENENQT
jgi:hypothetical protein